MEITFLIIYYFRCGDKGLTRRSVNGVSTSIAGIAITTDTNQALNQISSKFSTKPRFIKVTTKDITPDISDDNNPFTYIKNGQNEGLYFDLASAVLKSMGTDYQIETYPFKRALLMAMEGKGIVVGVFKNEERAERLEFSEPFYFEESVLFINKNNKFPFNVIGDLRGKRLGVKLGWSYGVEFDLARKNKLFSTIEGSAIQIYKLLDIGRLDAVVDNKLSGIATIKDLNINQNVGTLPQHLVLGGIHIAAKKGTSTEIINIFNAHVSRIKDSGEYQKIVTKYYSLASAGSENTSQ